MTVLPLIGAAHIHTPAYIDTILYYPDARATYVSDHDAERARTAAKRLDADVSESLERIWRDTRVAGVVICTETRLRPGILNAAIDAGKAIFVENPMTRTWMDAHTIEDKAIAAGTIFQTG